MEGWIQQAFECLQTAKEHCAEMKSPVAAEENKIEILHLSVCKTPIFLICMSVLFKISKLIHRDGCAHEKKQQLMLVAPNK